MLVKDKIRFLIACMLAVPFASIEQNVIIRRMLPYKVIIVNDVAHIYNIYNSAIYIMDVTNLDLSILDGNEIYLYTEQYLMSSGTRATIRRDNILLTISFDNYINTLCMLFKINDVSYDLIMLIQTNTIYQHVLKHVIKKEQKVLVTKQSECKSCNIAKITSGAITLTHSILDPVNHPNKWSRTNIKIESIKNLNLCIWYISFVRKLSYVVYLYSKGE